MVRVMRGNHSFFVNHSIVIIPLSRSATSDEASKVGRDAQSSPQLWNVQKDADLPTLSSLTSRYVSFPRWRLHWISPAGLTPEHSGLQQVPWAIQCWWRLVIVHSVATYFFKPPIFYYLLFSIIRISYPVRKLLDIAMFFMKQEKRLI